MTVTRHSLAERTCAVVREMQCERDECALPRSGFKPVRAVRFLVSVNTPLRLGRVTEKPLAHALHCALENGSDLYTCKRG